MNATLNPTSDEPQPFTIDNEDKANWFLRKIANHEAEIERVKSQANSIIRALEVDKERLLFLFENQLKDLCREMLSGNGNRSKSIKFLQGSCSFRTVPEGFKLSNEMTALAFAKTTHPEAVKLIERVDWEAYKQLAQSAYQNHGKLIPGVDHVPARESFLLKFPKLVETDQND
jgi:hypothetical protein